VVDDLVDLHTDWQIHIVPPPQLDGGERGGNTLDDLRSAGDDFGRRPTATDLFTRPAVAAMAAGAGYDHVAQAGQALQSPGPSGKRLDFLAQEMAREANTIGSKAASAEVVQEVVALKSAIERLREQVQNVE